MAPEELQMGEETDSSIYRRPEDHRQDIHGRDGQVFQHIDRVIGDAADRDLPDGVQAHHRAHGQHHLPVTVFVVGGGAHL